MSTSESSGTRGRLLLATAELLRRQGYAATSVKQVTAAAAAPMGSLYHHFPAGKQQLVAAALRSAGAAYLQLLPTLLDEHTDLPGGLGAVFAAAADDIENTGWANMCPVGTVAGEIADTEPELRVVAAEVIGSWIEEGTRYFSGRGLGIDPARELTLAVLGALEGAFILSRTLRSVEPLLAAGRSVAGLAAALALAPTRSSSSSPSSPPAVPTRG